MFRITPETDETLPPETKDEIGGSEALPRTETKRKATKAEFFILPFLVGAVALFSAWMLLREDPFHEEMLFFITILTAAGFISLTMSVWINTGNRIIEKYIDTGIGASIFFASVRLFQSAQDIVISSANAVNLEALEILLMAFSVIGAIIVISKVISLIKKANRVD